jgi:uncharacterized protein involved in response to NO
MTRTAESIRRHSGLALFSGGFRPFFLFASLWGGVVVPVWIASLRLSGGMIAGLDGRAWHIHEMLFGFLAGIIAGFLLTAIPNWTGRLPVTGPRLAGLFALWGAGRVVGLIPGLWPLAAAVVDCSFLIVFSLVVWREIVAGRNRRNVPVCLMVTALALANMAFHFGPSAPDVAALGQRIALSVAVGLIALIGGRIIPSFTQNWFAAHAIGPGPASFSRTDKIILTVTGLALALWIVAPFWILSGAALIAAGLGHVIRLSRWRGWKARSEPLVWILHVGYAWLGVGLGLLGASVCWPEGVALTAGVHAITAGAIGVMTLAVMTRATRGHTGRPREADRATLAIYLTVIAAALIRVLAPFSPDLSAPLLSVSAALWALAFAGFAAAYGPMLLQRKAGG